ncbi:MAG: Rieske 2Fe-2S domain-containing protein, partial [Spirochaetales bacterium]|nr:Rieske 2Fe-2S domain-containing protein [Spirochaetales bacterium]
VKDFGAVAVDGGWDLFVGGNAGGKVAAAQKIARVKTADEVVRIADRFYEFYRKNGRFGERTAPFVERVGLETVIDAVLYDTDEALLRLENDLAQALANVKDPWKSGIDLTDTLEASSPTPPVLPFDGQLDLGAEQDIPPGENRLVSSPWGEVVIFHGRDGRWAASESRCPHQGGPMVDCQFIAGKLTCPLHSFVFDARTGSCGNAEVTNLRVWKVSVLEGRILLSVEA